MLSIMGAQLNHFRNYVWRSFLRDVVDICLREQSIYKYLQYLNTMLKTFPTTTLYALRVSAFNCRNIFTNRLAARMLIWGGGVIHVLSVSFQIDQFELNLKEIRRAEREYMNMKTS